MEDMIALLRQSYIEKIEHHLGKNMIIILTGQRRVGKSCVLRLFKDKISGNKENNIVYIDKEKYMFDDIRTYHDLNAYIDEHRDPKKMNYILVDEIQDIDGFEKSIRSYYEEPDVEIIITGSNSSMLSSDLSNKIGGRYKEIYVQSLSYEEFMDFHNLSDSDETLSKYIQFGGLPGLIRYGLDEEDAREYQMDVFNT
ncbi:MAG: AAA family ATPase, partial [Paludibacteraceae bacterium]|nr:AAA family ATPase [Paludibacteraceae bacterium]